MSKLLNYEIHITVNCPDSKIFKDVCKDIGVKPIWIDTYNTQHQVMTSSTHKGNDYKSMVKYISSQLKLYGYDILRQKVEIKPESIPHKNHIYYECHIRLKIDKGKYPKGLGFICEISGFHRSKNLFKVYKDYEYQMITYRDRNANYVNFSEYINKMTNLLDSIGLKYDKIEIEECIMDTNEQIDKKWMNYEN